jgi:hypothetical protein
MMDFNPIVRRDSNRLSTGMVGIAIIIVSLVGIAGWCLERWINWKLSYGPAVEQRLESIEQRIEELEKRNAKADHQE